MKIIKIDAKKDRKIHVLPVDLIGAVCKDHQKCVIAKAIKRATNAAWVDVAASTVLVKRKHQTKATRFILKPIAREQIAYFDQKGNFAPCMVLLSAPRLTQKLSYRPRHDVDKPHSGPYRKHRKQPAR